MNFVEYDPKQQENCSKVTLDTIVHQPPPPSLGHTTPTTLSHKHVILYHPPIKGKLSISTFSIKYYFFCWSELWHLKPWFASVVLCGLWYYAVTYVSFCFVLCHVYKQPHSSKYLAMHSICKLHLSAPINIERKWAQVTTYIGKIISHLISLYVKMHIRMDIHKGTW